MRPLLATSRRLTALAIATPLALAPAVTRDAAAVTTQVGADGLVRLRLIDSQAAAGEVPGWGGDENVDGGDRGWSDQVSTAGVAKAAPAGVYETQRYGADFEYHLRDLKPRASYVLRLHFAEDYWDAPGKRVFDVTSNGTRVLTGLDVFAAAGGARKALVREVSVTADAAGVVTLRFKATKDNAVLGGIEILRRGAATAPVAPASPHAAALTSRRVLVDWKGDVEAGTYTVYRDGRRLATTTQNAYADATAQPGRTYAYRVVANGPTYRPSAPSAIVKATTPASDALVATGRYTTRNGYVVAPDGTPFVPVGANLGTPNTASGSGVADGHAVQAKAWGWNAVRLTFFSSDEYWWTYRTMNGYDKLLAEVRSVVGEYRKAGLVVLIDGHDNPQEAPDPEKVRAQMTTFWKDVATMYKGDSGVWFNLINEPRAIDEDWYVENARFLAAIRATGNTSIAVVDAPAWGQDLGGAVPYFANARRSYDDSMAPRLAARYGNVVVSQHNYGANEAFQTAEGYGRYAQTVQAAGLPLVTGETGFTTDLRTSQWMWDANHLAAKATFASNPKHHVGTFVWNGTHNDGFSLKADGGPFYSGASAGAGLSELGRGLWALTH